MENEMFFTAVSGLLVAISLLAVVAALLFAWLQYKKGAFFCFLPKNHLACVVVNDNPIAYIMHAADAEQVKAILPAMLEGRYISPEALKDLTEKITVRSAGVTGLLVDWFNIHLTSINPFATIKEIEVIKTFLKDRFEPGSDISTHVEKPQPVSARFLRIAWPRTVLAPEVELKGQIQIDMIVQATKILVWNFPKIYFEFSGKVSARIDEALGSMLVNQFGTKTIDEFQIEDMTAKTGKKSLHQQLQNKGLEAVGAYLEGGIAVVDWDLVKDQQIIRDANLQREAAKAIAEATITEATGKATAEPELGKGEAKRIEARGAAYAKASELTVAAYQNDTKSASDVEKARELSKPESKIQVLGGSAIVNLEKGE